MKLNYVCCIWLAIAFSNLFPVTPTSAQSARTIQVTLSPQVAQHPVNGRLFVFFSQRSQQPMNGPSWFSPEPFFAMDVSQVGPGDTLTVDDSADCLADPLSRLPAGEYQVQALLDHDFYYSRPGAGPGNFHSQPVTVTIAENSDASSPIELLLDQVVAAPTYEDSEFVKFVEIESALLSEFHSRPVLERALVVLPPSYHTQPNRRFPVYVEVTGFGGTLNSLQRRWRKGLPASGENQTEFIRVFLTGQCKWGHHVYANSATNGPRGDMLVRELIPEIDRQFRTIAEPTARFVGGHSSGGWSSLWLQVSYPDQFGGVWSTAPDPVDFRDWQGTNLYDASANVYFDAEGQQRPLARNGNQVLVTYKDFTRMDDVLGRGGQIRSFDAVFSPRDESGQPVQLWDRQTGEVSTAVLEHWKQYDISLLLQQNWQQLAPRLAGKLHVYMGDTDTFYLEGATILLGQRLRELGSDAVVEIFPDKNHGNLLTPELRNRILQEMSAQFWKHHPRDP